MNTLPPPDQKPRRPLRPLYGIPEPEKRGREGWFLSALLHAVIITALILPPFVARQLVEPEQQGAGGAGPAGGGGGGTRGTGGDIRPERVRFLQMVPAAAAPAPVPPRALPTPTPTPPPPPVEPEPEKAVPEETPAAPATASPTIATPGTGGGSGTDGSGGNGPGSGGGVGSGVGTGRGSGVGPGTGGGGDAIFPPTAYQIPLLPVPVPRGVRPYRLVAQFEVDERGNARLLSFNPTSDRAYNRKVREMLEAVRFKPATRADGTAVKDTAYLRAEAH